MLPGLSFFRGCLQKRRAKRIYLLDPSHKDNEPQNGGVQQGGVRVGTPRETHVTGESHYSVCINSAASLLLYVRVTSMAVLTSAGFMFLAAQY